MFQTILDLNEVFATEACPPACAYIRQGNRLLQCVRRDDGIFLDRLISTNPQDYLNPRYQVGQLVQK